MSLLSIWTATAPALVDLAERACKSLATEEPCTHTEEEGCTKERHLKPTPIGALMLLGLMFVGLYMTERAATTSSRIEVLEKDMAQVKVDVGDVKNYLMYGHIPQHASAQTPTPAIPINRSIIPDALADEE